MTSVLFALWLAAPVAFADAIPMEPNNCPLGSSGRSSHAGTWCEATTCAAESDCADGQGCRSVGLCVDVQEWACGGMMPETAEPCTFTVNEAKGRCSTDADCTGTATCVTANRCTSTGLLGCGGCDSTASISGFAAIGGFIMLGVLGPRRRRT